MLRHPFLHFLVIAGALFLFRPTFPASPEPIRLTNEDVQQVRLDWRKQTGSWPDDAALNAALEHRADEERLLREALRLGMEQQDIVIHRRVQQNFELLGLPVPDDAAELVERAQQLGLLRSDLVLRRRLAQTMRARISSRAAHKPIELNKSQTSTKPLFLIEQVWFPPETSRTQIEQSRHELEHGANPESFGQRFLLGQQMGPWTSKKFDQMFGGNLAQFLAQSEPGRWSPMVSSVYGTHLIRVIRRVEPDAQAKDNRIGMAYRNIEDQQQAAILEALQRLRQRYPIELAAHSEIAL